MKKAILLFLLMGSSLVYGQYYYVPYTHAGQNPGGLNTDTEYPVGGGLSATWTQVLAGSQATPVWSSAISLPFNFSFNGTTVTSYKVSSSGVVTFTQNPGTAPSYTNASLPNAAIPDNSICVWGLAGTGSNDIVVQKTFGSAPNRQYWIFFSSYSEGGAASSFWTYWSIVLEETSNKIYIVDQRTQTGTTTTLTAGIQINSTTAFQIAGSPNLANLAGADATPADNSYYTFIYGTQPSYDLMVSKIDMSPYALLSAAPFQVKGEIKNFGTSTVTSFTLNYQVGNSPVVSAPITTVNLASYGSYSFTHPTSWSPTSASTYLIKVWASNINGNNDQNPANDTASMQLQILNQMVQRLPLHEGFTSSTCAPCVAGNTNLKSIFTANPNKYTCVKYQMSWPGNGDPYYTAEGGDRRTYYGINSVPWLMVDGQLNKNTSAYTQAEFDYYYQIPAFVNLTASHTIIGHTVNVTVNIDPIANISSNQLILHCAIIENKTTQNVGSNGETEFFYVMKKMVPSSSGTALTPLTSGSSVTKNLSWTFVGSYRLPPNALSPINNATEHSVEEFTDLSVVVWIQDNADKKIYQSAWSTFAGAINEKPDGNGIIALFPNPAATTSYIRYQTTENVETSIKVFNLTGQKMLDLHQGMTQSGIHSVSLNTESFPEGMYIVQLTVGNRMFSSKLIIER